MVYQKKSDGKIWENRKLFQMPDKFAATYDIGAKIKQKENLICLMKKW